MSTIKVLMAIKGYLEVGYKRFYKNLHQSKAGAHLVSMGSYCVCAYVCMCVSKCVFVCAHVSVRGHVSLCVCVSIL